VEWLRKLLGRDRPPHPPPDEPSGKIDPLVVETAPYWTAEDQAVPDAESGEEERDIPDR
jgi:hypothetical protein